MGNPHISSFCHTGGCVEVQYIVSTVCSGGDCVEVGLASGGTVVVRDTKDRSRVLAFTPDEWDAFLLGAKLGEFDLARLHTGGGSVG